MNTKRAAGKTPPLERLLTQLEYYTDFDPERGAFIIKRKRAYSRQEIGTELGYPVVTTKGKITSRSVHFFGKQYAVPHLVWLWHYGEFPTHGIDHINGDPLDNRLSNLRDVPQLLNGRNCSMKKNNTTGHTNINWDLTRDKYIVRVRIGSKRRNVGRFTTLKEAVEAREDFLLANPQLGYTDRHGKR